MSTSDQLPPCKLTTLPLSSRRRTRNFDMLTGPKYSRRLFCMDPLMSMKQSPVFMPYLIGTMASVSEIHGATAEVIDAAELLLTTLLDRRAAKISLMVYNCACVTRFRGAAGR